MPELGANDKLITENGKAEELVLGESPPHSPPIEVHFEPVVQLPLVDVSLNEEDEQEMIKLRAKLYRYDTTDSPAEWKERGTGEVKLLRHKIKNTVRIVMRRDKTLKICANHFVWPWMELNPNCSSDRAWIWSALADFADEQPKPQLLAIRFANVENAKLWKETFDKAKKIVESECEAYSGKPDSDDSDCEDSSSDSQDESKTRKSESEVTVDSKEQNDKSEITKADLEVTTDFQKLEVKDQD